jgi:hypothetical protein
MHGEGERSFLAFRATKIGSNTSSSTCSCRAPVCSQLWVIIPGQSLVVTAGFGMLVIGVHVSHAKATFQISAINYNCTEGIKRQQD